MWLSALAAQNFRCLEKYSIEPHPRLNLFVGANAAGKTSLLESTFVWDVHGRFAARLLGS